ncbi:hypothetical protein CVD25_21050 [Bacillus canaveralius]|uniref:Uncharacterized protein n=1 Tax=Bacillus canaveralius TaxID=1403243 RepID=A0A2N5GGS7_9BACI|nr:hypothetical protein [Bacillus canaveralius]PLR79964.1 hypothetical protein CU635_20285 [Bacillus canaveralius]PLR89510.1 hypothetical protein CVD25_21050 [Bacillus canaveralius]
MYKVIFYNQYKEYLCYFLVDETKEALSQFKKTGYYQNQGTLAQGIVYRQDTNGEHTIKEGRILV